MRKGLRCLLLLVTCAVFVSNASPAVPNCDPQFNGDMDDKWFELTGREEGKELDGNRVRETSRRERVFIHSWALGCNEMIFDIYSKEGGEWTLVETLWGVRVFPGTNGNRGILAYHTGVIDTVAGFQQVGANGDGFALMTLGGSIELLRESTNRMSMDIWAVVVQEGSTQLLRLKGSTTRAPGWYEEMPQ